jgi:hypothetical protein
MKLKGTILGILVVILFAGCETFDGFLEDFGVTVTTDYIEVEIMVPPAPAGFPIVISSDVQSDLESLLADKGYTNATVQNLKLADVILEVDETSPVGNFNSIDTLSTSIETTELPQKNVANCKNEQADADILNMNTSNADLLNYVKNNSYSLHTSGMLKEHLTDTLRMKGKINFRVTVLVGSL